MESSYEELLQYDIYAAILKKAEEPFSFQKMSADEIKSFYKNPPYTIAHHPLLLDYNFVYNNIEILLKNNFFYKEFQGVDEYYFLFKVIIDKYSLEEDYIFLLSNDKNTQSFFKHKWRNFAYNLVILFGNAPDNVLQSLLEKNDFVSYFLKYPFIYDASIIENFGTLGIEKFLEYDNISSYYINNSKNLIILIDNHPDIKIPQTIIENKNVIKQISANPNIEIFYHDLDLIFKQSNTDSYIEEHKKFCDLQVNLAENGIIPCLKNDYINENDFVKKEDFLLSQKYCLKDQVAVRIFQKMNVNFLSKGLFYQELSKYFIVGMFISRYFETDPYNLLIDIETLYQFAKDNNRTLNGNFIYEFLCDFESKSVFEIIDFYKRSTRLSLMEILYNDWNNQKDSLVKEINSNLMEFNNLSSKTNEFGINYYDITDVDGLILVHNTSIPINDLEKLKYMLNKLKNGSERPFCLSVQDKNHQEFYEKEDVKNLKTFKLVFKDLDANRVGITYHKDACSVGITSVNPENTEYIRKLYTLKEFMDKTKRHNEITYAIFDKTFLPIAIICEDEITDEEVKVSKLFNIPILFRKKKDLEKKVEPSDKTLVKYYSSSTYMLKLFS